MSYIFTVVNNMQNKNIQALESGHTLIQFQCSRVLSKCVSQVYNQRIQGVKHTHTNKGVCFRKRASLLNTCPHYRYLYGSFFAVESVGQHPVHRATLKRSGKFDLLMIRKFLNKLKDDEGIELGRDRGSSHLGNNRTIHFLEKGTNLALIQMIQVAYLGGLWSQLTGGRCLEVD